jgi:hypothetical protein
LDFRANEGEINLLKIKKYNNTNYNKLLQGSLNLIDLNRINRFDSIPSQDFEIFSLINFISSDLESSYELFKSNSVYFNFFNKNFNLINTFFIKNYSFLFYINLYKINTSLQFFGSNFKPYDMGND